MTENKLKTNSSNHTIIKISQMMFTKSNNTQLSSQWAHNYEQQNIMQVVNAVDQSLTHSVGWSTQ